MLSFTICHSLAPVSYSPVYAQNYMAHLTFTSVATDYAQRTVISWKHLCMLFLLRTILKSAGTVSTSRIADIGCHDPFVRPGYFALKYAAGKIAVCSNAHNIQFRSGLDSTCLAQNID